MYITIKTLLEKGDNKTRISGIVGCSQKTVRWALKRIEQGEELSRQRTPSILD